MPFATDPIEELSLWMSAMKEPEFKQALTRPGGLKCYVFTLWYSVKRHRGFVTQVTGKRGIGKSEFAISMNMDIKEFHARIENIAEVHITYHTRESIEVIKDCHSRGVIALVVQDEKNRMGGHGSRALIKNLINILNQTRKAGHCFTLCAPKKWDELSGMQDCYFDVIRIDEDPSSPTYRMSEVIIFTRLGGAGYRFRVPIHSDEEFRASYEERKDTHIDDLIEDEGVVEGVDYAAMRDMANYIYEHWTGSYEETCADIGIRFPTLGIDAKVYKFVKLRIDKEGHPGVSTKAEESKSYMIGDLVGEELLRSLMRQEIEDALRHSGKRYWKRDAHFGAMYFVPPFTPFPQIIIKDQYDPTSEYGRAIHKITIQQIGNIIKIIKLKLSDIAKGAVGERYCAVELAKWLPTCYQVYLSIRPVAGLPDLQVVKDKQLVCVVNAKLYFWEEAKSESADTECEYTWDMKPRLKGLEPLQGGIEAREEDSGIQPHEESGGVTSDNKFVVAVLPRMRQVLTIPITSPKTGIKRGSSIGGIDVLAKIITGELVLEKVEE